MEVLSEHYNHDVIFFLRKSFLAHVGIYGGPHGFCLSYQASHYAFRGGAFVFSDEKFFGVATMPGLVLLLTARVLMGPLR